MDKETRNYIEPELANLYKAMAIVSTSPLGTTVGNIFFKVNSVSFPAEIFTNKEDAINWLKQYL